MPDIYKFMPQNQNNFHAHNDKFIVVSHTPLKNYYTKYYYRQNYIKIYNKRKIMIKSLTIINPVQKLIIINYSTKVLK